MSDDLQSIIQRLLTGNRDDADVQAIASAIQDGQLVLASGKGMFAAGGNVENSQIITGNSNVTGNNNFVVYGADAEVIQKVLAQRSPVALDALIQQVRPRASEKVLNNFGKIQLLNRRQVDVDQLYVDVYVLEVQDCRANIPGLLKGQNIREQFDRLGLAKRGERLQGLQVAESENYPRLMVLGKPGSGKSTFLRHLAVGCAKGNFLEDYIPYLLELRDVDEADFSLFQHIHEEFELAEEEQTKQLLRQGKVLILLDGLDEVSSVLQQKVQDELRRFAKQYDKNRFVLTCRTQTTEYIPEQFSPIEVADFRPEQVESFALNWFTAIAETPKESEALKENFMERLGEHPQTAELAVTPVLLSLTCWIFEDSQSLPEKRSDLYREGLDLLLRQWDDRRGISRETKSEIYRQLTLDARKQLLSNLAVRKFEQAENFVLFEESEICEYISEHLQISVEESKTILVNIAEQHGILVERAHKIWSFSHLTLQEYLASRCFLSQTEWQKLVANSLENHWQEVFVFVAESLSHGDEFILMLSQKNEEFTQEADEKIICFFNWLSEKSREVETNYNRSAVKAFYCVNAFDYVFNSGQISEAIVHSARNLTDLLGIEIESIQNKLLNLQVEVNSDLIFDRALIMLSGLAFAIIQTEDDLKFLLLECFKDTIESTVSIAPSPYKVVLEDLKHFVSRADDRNHESWWNEYGYEWIESLRILMIQRRAIHNCQFNEMHMQWLHHFFSMNLLLVRCVDAAHESCSAWLCSSLKSNLLLLEKSGK